MKIKSLIISLLLAVTFVFCCNLVFAQTVSFDNPITADSATALVNAVLSNLLKIIVLIAIVVIVYGGIMYVFSSGDEKKTGAAKGIITGAVMGLAIALAAPTLLKEILSIFSGSTTNPDMVGDALTIQQVALRVLKGMLSSVAIFAMIGIIIGGQNYMFSYGDEKKMEGGKKTIVASIIGLVIAVGALIFVRVVASWFGIS